MTSTSSTSSSGGLEEGQYYYPAIIASIMLFSWPLWTLVAGGTALEALLGGPIALLIAAWWHYEPGLPNRGDTI